MNRCEGLPNLPCGRVLSGREGWCLQHGDAEDRESRWAMNNLTKHDVDPNIGATERVRSERLPARRPPPQRRLAGFFEGEQLPLNPAEHGQNTMTPREEKAWAKGMAS